MRNLFLIILFVAGIYMEAEAQDSVRAPKGWNTYLEPYFLFPNMTGTVGLGNAPDIAIKADVADILRHLQFGAMIYTEVYSDKWTFSSDILYMHIAQDATAGIVVASGSVDVKQLGWELAVFRKMQPWLELGAAATLSSMNVKVDADIRTILGGTMNIHRSGTKTWIDPAIIGRIKLPLKGKYSAQIKGSLGGFGVGSNLAWQLHAYAGYRLSRLFQLSLGYRLMSVDYNKGSGDSRFLYNIDAFGPVLRFGFYL